LKAQHSVILDAQRLFGTRWSLEVISFKPFIRWTKYETIERAYVWKPVVGCAGLSLANARRLLNDIMVVEDYNDAWKSWIASIQNVV
jgi:hypothetical protein